MRELWDVVWCGEKDGEEGGDKGVTDKAWKRFERDVARHLGGERIYFRQGAGDVRQPRYCVE